MEVCTIDFSTEAVSNCTHFTESVYESCKEILPQNTVDLVEDTDIVSALNMLKGENSQKFRIVGDNWDLEVKARCQTKSQTNKSMHYFHAYAVKDRVVPKGLDSTGPQKSIDEIEMQEILPTPEVQEAIISDLAYIIPRVLVKYLTPYKAFSKAVMYHIPHAHSKEMAEKIRSAAEMAQILDVLQAKYVPTVTSAGGEAEILQKVIFDGIN
ncbi:hypothetical protein OS493_020821 [Desmophyllum pertusum]|uniref:Uncharacterized protein n=1 Tax=Desmophyllum pertusum TaxID=174260 RepID=A0A9X0CEF6_9CNID|nr:hypothetical protein OS493_020821 [Desmophyllum pertusum]